MAIIQILSGQNAGQLQQLTEAETIIGRRPDSQIVLPLETVSRHHAIIRREPGGYTIEDLNSTNGTLVNGQLIEGRRLLQDRDLIRIEGIVMRFLLDPSRRRSHDSDSAIGQEPVKMPTIYAMLDVSAVEMRLEVRPELKLRAMLQIIRSLEDALAIEDVLPKILDALMIIFPQAERAYILLAEEPKGDLRLRALRQRDAYSDKSLTMRPISRTVARRVMVEGTAMLSGDAAEDDRFEASQSVFTSDIHSLICAPLKAATQPALGVIQVDTRNVHDSFTEDDLEVLASVAVLAGQAVERSRMHEAQLRTARLAAIGQTVASIAHESRNALHSIALGLQVLERSSEDRPEELELVRLMQKDHQQVTQLLDDVRGFAAPLKLDRKLCSVREVWQNAWQQIGSQREGRQADLREELGDVDLQCSIDPSRMCQVFRNLLENALAVCQDPVQIDIVCSVVKVNGSEAVRIAVRDNGPGLSEEQRQKVFEAFFTTRAEGTGLGLAIVKRIIESHGGEIAVGREGRGAEFVIVLPRYPA